VYVLRAAIVFPSTPRDDNSLDEEEAVDERIFLRFEQAGEPMTVTSLKMDEGITFEEPEDASPLNVGLGLQSLQPIRIENVQRNHGWTNRQFGFDAALEEGGILLSGHARDRHGLPPGPYDVTVEVESYAFKKPRTRIILKEGGRAVIRLDVKPETRQIELNDNFDAATRGVIDASTVDDKAMASWLAGTVRPKPRIQRRVCALNILSRLAAPPTHQVKTGLTRHFEGVHFADVDRIYATADAGLQDALEGFVDADTWKGEGRPKHPIHEKVVTDAIKRFPDLNGRTLGDFDLQSYRQGGGTGLQVVVATPRFAHPRVYVDVDIDLGNPLWDVEGILIHLGELLDGGPTDHFKVRDKLADIIPKDFLFFTVKKP
jgi:hypothetical protein